MQNYILSFEAQFPQIYSQTKAASINNNVQNLASSVPSSASTSHSSSNSNLSSTSTEEILPNKLPLKRRLSEFRFGRDGGSLSLTKKGPTNLNNSTGGGAASLSSSNGSVNSGVTTATFTTNPFAFDKFKDITTAFTVHLHEDGILLDPGSIGPFNYNHPTCAHLLNSINSGVLEAELFVTLLELSYPSGNKSTSQAAASSNISSSLFYDGCVVVGVVEWRKGMALTIGNVANPSISRQISSNFQWARARLQNGAFMMNSGLKASANSNDPSNPSNSTLIPEIHKVLLKPTVECWQYALAFFAGLSDGAKFARILEDEEKLLEFERQLTLINEPLVCLDPSSLVMQAMNALYFDHYKYRLLKPLPSTEANPSIHEEFEQTLSNLAAMKPVRIDDPSNASSITSSPTNNTGNPTSPTNQNPRYRRIGLIESWQEREKRRTLEPIYGIDHRRQFVKNRQALPPSSFVPSNWRPFKTIRYEREITNNPNITNSASSTSSNITNGANNSSINTVISGSLTKLYYCVNVFYAPPPTFPPIQLFLQVGTSPDTSTSGFLHHLTFSNLIETENYLQNLRNLLLIENGNCNLKVITDISTNNQQTNTTSTMNAAAAAAAAAAASNNINAAANSASANVQRKPSHPSINPHQIQQQYQLTPHQILQLNQQQRGAVTTNNINNSSNSNNNNNNIINNNNSNNNIISKPNK